MKKMVLASIVILMGGLSGFGQTTPLCPINWYPWNNPPDFGGAPYTYKNVANVSRVPEGWTYSSATVDFDALWATSGTEHNMTNHVKDGDDVFDGGVTAGSSWKAIYDDDYLYLLLKFIDFRLESF